MDLNSEEIKDILREIGNIGGGHALTSLSMMLDQQLDLEVPVCRIVNRDDTRSFLKRPDALYCGVSLTMTGTIDCLLALLINREFTQMIIDTLDPDEPMASGSDFDVRSLTDMQKSALCEVGNIMGNSYITAVGQLLNLQIDVSVPSIVIDTGDRVLKTLIGQQDSHSDKLLFINSSLTAPNKLLESYMLLCPTNASLTSILEHLMG